MRISPEHGRAFGYWKTPEVLRRAAKLHPPNIHQLVNLHAGPARNTGGADALHLVILKRRNAAHSGAPFDMAEVLAPSQWCKNNEPKRYYQMRRWLRALLNHRKHKRTT